MANQLLCHLELSVFHVELGVVHLLYEIWVCARFSSLSEWTNQSTAAYLSYNVDVEETEDKKREERVDL